MARKTAVCIGLNSYAPASKVSSLRGCINDALLIGQMLTKAGFTVRQIHNARATQEEILAVLEREVAQLRAGDHLVFWNSSHGYQVRDRARDELFDYLDEAVCSYDTDLNDPLTDDKFARILSRAHPDATVIFGSDSCHSATLTRAIWRTMKQLAVEGLTTDLLELDQPVALRELQARAWQTIVRDGAGPVSADGTGGPLYRLPRLFVPQADFLFENGEQLIDLRSYDDEGESQPDLDDFIRDEEVAPGDTETRRFGSLARRTPEHQMRHILLSGCKAEEVSMDAWFPQGFHGAMTYHFARAVLQAWKRGRAITYREAHQTVLERLNEDGFSQQPQLEGPAYLKDAPVFGYKPEPQRRNHMPTGKQESTQISATRSRDRGDQPRQTSRVPAGVGQDELAEIITSLKAEILASLKSEFLAFREEIEELREELDDPQRPTAGGLAEQDLWDQLWKTLPGEQLQVPDEDPEEILKIMRQLMVTGRDYLPNPRPRDPEEFDVGAHIAVTVNWWWGPFGMAEVQFDQEAIDSYTRAITLENLLRVRVPPPVAGVIVGVVEIIRNVSAGNGVIGYFNMPTLAHIWVPR